MVIITLLPHVHEDIFGDPLPPYLEYTWSRDIASSMGRPLSLSEFLLSAEGDTLFSLTILCVRQTRASGQYREFSMEKTENRATFPKKIWQPTKVHILSPVCSYSMCSFSMRAQATDTRDIFSLNLTLLTSSFLNAPLFLFSSLTATIIEDPCGVKHCIKCFTLFYLPLTTTL